MLTFLQIFDTFVITILEINGGDKMNLKTMNNILIVLYGICIVLVITALVIFLIDYSNLNKFKRCYDINFQDTKCQKYINY